MWTRLEVRNSLKKESTKTISTLLASPPLKQRRDVNIEEEDTKAALFLSI
jgi:hypothetical protein